MVFNMQAQGDGCEGDQVSPILQSRCSVLIPPVARHANLAVLALKAAQRRQLIDLIGDRLLIVQLVQLQIYGRLLQRVTKTFTSQTRCDEDGQLFPVHYRQSK